MISDAKSAKLAYTLSFYVSLANMCNICEDSTGRFPDENYAREAWPWATWIWLFKLDCLQMLTAHTPAISCHVYAGSTSNLQQKAVETESYFWMCGFMSVRSGFLGHRSCSCFPLACGNWILMVPRCWMQMGTRSQHTAPRPSALLTLMVHEGFWFVVNCFDVFFLIFRKFALLSLHSLFSLPKHAILHEAMMTSWTLLGFSLVSISKGIEATWRISMARIEWIQCKWRQCDEWCRETCGTPP